MDINTVYDKARGGDPQAEEALFELLTSRFRLFAYQKIGNKAEAEEVVQEAVTTIFAEYGQMTFDTSFAAWACKVFDFRVLGYFRRRKIERERFDSGEEDESGSGGATVTARPELKMRLRDCLQEVCRRNIRYARILNLHYLGFKTDEICDRINIKPATLYSALSKARAMLEDCLERKEVKQ